MNSQLFRALCALMADEKYPMPKDFVTLTFGQNFLIGARVLELRFSPYGYTSGRTYLVNTGNDRGDWQEIDSPAALTTLLDWVASPDAAPAPEPQPDTTAN